MGLRGQVSSTHVAENGWRAMARSPEQLTHRCPVVAPMTAKYSAQRPRHWPGNSRSQCLTDAHQPQVAAVAASHTRRGRLRGEPPEATHRWATNPQPKVLTLELGCFNIYLTFMGSCTASTRVREPGEAQLPHSQGKATKLQILAGLSASRESEATRQQAAAIPGRRTLPEGDRAQKGEAT